MFKGIQTHFNAIINPDLLIELKKFGYEAVRIDAQVCSPEEMMQMFNQAVSAGLVPFVIINSEDKLHVLPSDIDVEWTNEPDGDISPSDYWPLFNSACLLAKSRGIRLWGPTISNLDEDSLRWLNDLRNEGGGWPEGLYGVSVHRYGDGTFEHPHNGFQSRDSEVKWLKAACVDKPFLVSEVGYPTIDHITEEIQKENLLKEFTFWEGHGAYSLFVYQLNDGHDDNEHYGVRTVDGKWKLSAKMFMNEGDEEMPRATEGILKENLIPVGDKFVARYPSNTDTVLSIQPGGDWATRPAGTAGAWELAKLRDNALVYEVEGHTYFIPVR